MSRRRPTYPLDVRERMIGLVRSGRSPEELEREFEPRARTIRLWLKQAERDEGRLSDGLPRDEREELNRLRRDNRRLRQEQEILSKAAAWFAREAGTLPSTTKPAQLHGSACRKYR